MYDVKSLKAEEFINDEEILESLAFAAANKNNRELIESILEKAKAMQGISHREAAVLLECDLPDITERIYALAKHYKYAYSTSYNEYYKEKRPFSNFRGRGGKPLCFGKYIYKSY